MEFVTTFVLRLIRYPSSVIVQFPARARGTQTAVDLGGLCSQGFWRTLQAQSTQDATRKGRKQMGPVDVNGGVHTACKQHQRKNIRICAASRPTSCVDWASSLSSQCFQFCQDSLVESRLSRLCRRVVVQEALPPPPPPQAYCPTQADPPSRLTPLQADGRLGPALMVYIT